MMEALHRPAQRYGLDVLGQRWPDGVLENVVSHQMLTDFPRSGERCAGCPLSTFLLCFPLSLED